MIIRRTFLYPTIEKIKKGQVGWLFEQTKKWLILKYLNKILPKKIRVGPTMAILAMTYRCNSHCLMCNLAKRVTNQKEYSTEQWKNIIDRLAEIKTAGIGFTGGEPLLLPDMAELIDYANQKGISTTLNTNGLLFTKKKIKKILDARPDNINLSLDSTDPKTFDRLRGTHGGLKNLIQIIENLTKERSLCQSPTEITVVACVSHHNLDELEKIAKLCAKLGVDKLGFIPRHSFYKNKKNELISTQDNSPQISQRFKEKIKKIKAAKIIPLDNSFSYLATFPFAFAGQKSLLPCLAGETSITIDCYGQIFGCWPFLELEKPAFRITPQKRLKDLWYGKEYEKIRKEISQCRGCFWNCHVELSIFYR